MSLQFLPPVLMSLSPMLHAEYKKCPCRPVDFRAQGLWGCGRVWYGGKRRRPGKEEEWRESKRGEWEGRGGVRRRSLRELSSSPTILQHVHHVHTFGMLWENHAVSAFEALALAGENTSHPCMAAGGGNDSESAGDVNVGRRIALDP